MNIASLPKLPTVDLDLPQTLLVHDPDDRISDVAQSIPYKRVLPAPSSSDSLAPKAHATSHGQLHLTRASRIGCGHHSNVYRAAFIVGEHAPAAVVAKVAVARQAAREMLEHEARVYDGLALGFVPRFFGYYAPFPESAASGSSPSPILLLEECGEVIDPGALSDADKAQIISLFHQLHDAGLLQKSPFRKNILVDSQSEQCQGQGAFRIIDFGRAVEKDSQRVPEEQEQGWAEMCAEEIREVKKVLKMKMEVRPGYRGG
ncbi:Protein kinase domain-containing protein [Mycena chlorophos]|uniref:Protein kinase domain-containing protein n=1 Tax=Mycena chlorophos TaxID=658473 RepID=A0A8H6TK63_MYCCL|nr:Protein kinase domain-containing protein [Mycena chlorophos]